MKADKLNGTLVYYLRLLIQTELLFQDEEPPNGDEGSAASTNTSQVSAPGEQAISVEDENLQNMNFTKVTDLATERRVFDLYKRIVLHVLKRLESKTTLEEDLQLLCSEELDDWKMRTAIVYRSERKKILHSQLHLITWLQHVLNTCD